MRAARALHAGRGRRRRRTRAGLRRAPPRGVRQRGEAAREAAAAAPRDPDQPGAARPVLRSTPRRCCSARTSRRRAASTRSPRACTRRSRQRARVQHAARRDDDPRPRAGLRATWACCRSRRSSTWRTSTTPATRSAARPARCSSSRNDQYRNPMVMRIASLGYQRGFGGHFHNDNSIAALRDIPGLVVGCPSRGDDAAMMLRTLLALAKVDGRVCAFLEPIALYMTKDLHEAGDGQWLFAVSGARTRRSTLGEARVYDDGGDATCVDRSRFGNGVPMSLRAARAIEEKRGWKVRVRRPALAAAAQRRRRSRGTRGECARILVRRRGPAQRRRGRGRHHRDRRRRARRQAAATRGRRGHVHAAGGCGDPGAAVGRTMSKRRTHCWADIGSVAVEARLHRACPTPTLPA